MMQLPRGAGLLAAAMCTQVSRPGPRCGLADCARRFRALGGVLGRLPRDVPLARGRLGPGNGTAPQPGRWILARGQVRRTVGSRYGGGGLAPRCGLAWAAGAVNAAESASIVVLLFSGTTVMVRCRGS